MSKINEVAANFDGFIKDGVVVGERVDRIIGLCDENELTETIKKHI